MCSRQSPDNAARSRQSPDDMEPDDTLSQTIPAADDHQMIWYTQSDEMCNQTITRELPHQRLTHNYYHGWRTPISIKRLRKVKTNGRKTKLRRAQIITNKNLPLRFWFHLHLCGLDCGAAFSKIWEFSKWISSLQGQAELFNVTTSQNRRSQVKTENRKSKQQIPKLKAKCGTQIILSARDRHTIAIEYQNWWSHQELVTQPRLADIVKFTKATHPNLTLSDGM